MTFRATNILPVKALAGAKQTAFELRRFSQTSVSAMAAGPVSADRLLSVLDSLISYKKSLEDFAATPGIAQYAKDQEVDQTYDIVANFNAMLMAITNVIDEIVLTFPVATFLTLNADGSRSYQLFSVASTVALRADLDAVVSAIS